MKSICLIVLGTVTLSLFAKEESWLPTTNVTVKPGPFQDLLINGRAFDIYQHGVKPEWGYKKPQQDIFVVVHPKKDRKNAPLYVVLHSAGHDVLKCVKCTGTVGDHDIYHSPDDFYGLYLDCRFNKGDWWWGGMYLNAPDLIKKNAGGDPMPVERRVIDVVTQNLKITPGSVFKWTYGLAKGTGKSDAQGLMTIQSLKMSGEPKCLTVSKQEPIGGRQQQ